MQAAYQKNVEQVLEDLDGIKKSSSQKAYEHDITLCFWFAVHLEDLELVQGLLEKEMLVKQLVACAFVKDSIYKNN